MINGEDHARDRILRFLGLSNGVAKTEVPVRVDPYFTKTHGLVGGSPVSSRIDAWRRDLSDRQIEDFEFTAGSALRTLGYDTVYGTSAQERRYYKYFDALFDACLSLFWQLPRRVLRRFLTRLRRGNA